MTRSAMSRACAWVLPLLLACNKQGSEPTSPPTGATVATPESPVQPEPSTGAVVETNEEPELAGTHRIVEPGEMRSGLYEKPVAGAVESRSKDAIKSVVRAHIPEIRACYERGVVRQPDLAGTLRLTFTIAEDGKVDSTKTEFGFPDASVAECIVGVVNTFVFPPAPGQGVVIVTYPFVLKTDTGGT